MFVDAFILAFVVVVWITYLMIRLFSSRNVAPVETTGAPAKTTGDKVFIGGTATKDGSEVIMTTSDKRKKNQYGFIEFGTVPEQFSFRFEMLIEEPDLGDALHAFVWLCLDGNPDKEAAVSSNATIDGGTRVFLMKVDAFGRRERLEVFRSTVGLARPSATSPWDLVERVRSLPKNQWVLVRITGDLRIRTFDVSIDDARYSFVVPMRFEGSFKGPAKAYLGAKTLEGTGIRVRNLGVAA